MSKFKEFFNKHPKFTRIAKKFMPLWIAIAVILAYLIAFIVVGATSKDWGAAAKEVFVQWFVANLIGIQALLIGFLILIGYLLSKRSFLDAFLGMIKGMMGIIILTMGSKILINTARPIFLALGTLGGANSSTAIVPLDPYFGLASANDFFEGIGNNIVSVISLALVFGFFVNLVLVAIQKLTNLRTVFVTGHIMLQQAAMMSIMVYLGLFATNGIEGQGAFWGTAIISGIAVGIYWSVGSSLNYYATQKVTDNAGFAVGHQQMIALAIAYKVGKYFGRKEHTAEERKLPKFFKVFEDNIFSQVMIILILFTILILIIQFAPGIPDNARFFVYNEKDKIFTLNPNFKVTINKTTGTLGEWGKTEILGITSLVLGVFQIVGSILVIVYGVRMFVTELQQSFQGISDRLLPNSTVAVDVAATFGYAQNSVTYGFLSGTLGQFISVGILIGINSGLSKSGGFPIVLPIFITLFFNSGAIGVYANASGGYKAALIVPFLFGIVGILLSAAGIYGVSNTYKTLVNEGSPTIANVKDNVFKPAPSPFAVGYNGMADVNIFFAPFGALLTASGKAAGFIVFLWCAVFLAVAQFIKYNDEDKQSWIRRKLHHLFANKAVLRNSTN